MTPKKPRSQNAKGKRRSAVATQPNGRTAPGSKREKGKQSSGDEGGKKSRGVKQQLVAKRGKAKDKESKKSGARRPIGRPPKYDAAFIEKLADEMLDWFLNPETFEENYWLKRFFWEHKLPADYASKFAEQNEYFREAYKKCKDVQEYKLVDRGMSQPGANAMCIFALKNVAQWRDRQEVGTPDEMKQRQVMRLGGRVVEF